MTSDTKIISTSTNAFKDSIDPHNILNQIDNLIKLLKNEKNTDEQNKHIVHFYKKAKQWQIVTIEDKDKNRVWVQAPMEYRESYKHIKLLDRLKHLAETGFWKYKKQSYSHIYMVSNASIPFNVYVEPNLWIHIKDNDTQRTIHLMTELKGIFQGLLMTGHKTIGVFNKPNGIIAMNKIKQWLIDNERHPSQTWNSKYTLETTTIYDMLNSVNYNIEVKEDTNNTYTTKSRP